LTCICAAAVAAIPVIAASDKDNVSFPSLRTLLCHSICLTIAAASASVSRLPTQLLMQSSTKN